jgi:predicted Zn-dependent protease
LEFQTVAVHELGHSLGLAHSFVYNAIMYPYYKGQTPAQLDYDDILGMYQLYSEFLGEIFTFEFFFLKNF